ncbi:MAG TPA: hypothetical protein VJH03_19935 [Blastocatellia bacterium]|nr:hypothetical protein [Blastocatellia bacterium]
MATNCFTGFLIQSNGSGHLTNNDITGPGGAGTGVNILSASSEMIDAALGPNEISGFATGVNAAGNATINGNAITGNTTGVAVGNPTPTVNMSFNRIAGNGAGLTNAGPGVVNAENNWWGCNAGPRQCDITPR